MKKILALASLTALSGLVVAAAAGCLSGGLVPEDPGPADVVTQDHNVGVPRNPEFPEDSSTTCPSNAPIDTSQVRFRTPKLPVVGACTDADFQAMEATAKAGFTEIVDLEANVSAACIACAFGEETDAMWAPLVSNVGGNVGACLALLSHNDECGRAYAAFDECTKAACTDCTDDDDLEQCSDQAAQGTCDTQRVDVLVVCGANVQTYLEQCDHAGTGGCTTCAGPGGDVAYPFETYVVEQCVHDPRDPDAGAPDGG